MNKPIVFALAVSTALAPAFAQDTITSTSGSGSNAEAASGSVSGADVSNAANNAIGNSQSNSASGAEANSGSISGAASSGNDTAQDQQQGQELTNNITITTPNTPQSVQGAQGSALASGTSMATSLNFNTVQRKRTEVRTNTAVPLAASSSFSSDYCGGTASGGVSAAPIGISIGGSGPKFDKSCQALRRAEKFGMAAANAANLGQRELANRLMTMMIWSICTADSAGPKEGQPTAMACASAGLLGSSMAAASHPAPPPPPPTNAAEPAVAFKGNITPEAAHRASATGNEEMMAAGFPH